MELKTIGTAGAREGAWSIEVGAEYREALLGLGNFSHAVVTWWASLADEAGYRALRRVDRPYVGAPEKLGIFATRSPMRPNPLCMSVVALRAVDDAKGRIELWWHDMEDGTPVLDIKPYHPSSDRVEAPRLPAWCVSWPKSLEASGDFDWSKVFLLG